MRTSSLNPRTVDALHLAVGNSGGRLRLGATALHTLLAETMRGEHLRAVPLNPNSLTRVLNKLTVADETETGLRVTRDRSAWVLTFAPDADDLDDWDF